MLAGMSFSRLPGLLQPVQRFLGLAPAALALLVLAGCNPFASSPVGARNYAQYCAGCHGVGGRGGDGGPDLTVLATREGGFPRRAVLNRLDGYGQGLTVHGEAAMPDMSYLMTGRLMPADLGRGARRMMPERIVALSAYLESIQR